MSAQLIGGETLADKIKQEVRQAVAAMSQPPKLAAILATDNPGAKFYAQSQAKSCAEVGIQFELHDPAKSGPLDTTEKMIAYVQKLNADRSVSGIILLMPVPQGVDGRAVQREIAPDKDADGTNPANVGKLFSGDFSLAPCTPHAVILLLKDAGVDLKGKETVVIGHSEIVGKPTVVMLLASMMESPTVACCHIATKDLMSHTKRAEVLIVAAGKAGLVKGSMIREGAVVIDVGINRVKVEEGGKSKTRIVGDVEFEVAKNVASAITPGCER